MEKQSRRGFLGFLGAAVAAPFVVNADLITDPAQIPTLPPLQQVDEAWESFIAESTRVVESTAHAGPIPQKYLYIRARADVKKHEIVCVEEGTPVGVAVSDIPKGHYGFVQIHGPSTVRVSV